MGKRQTFGAGLALRTRRARVGKDAQKRGLEKRVFGSGARQDENCLTNSIFDRLDLRLLYPGMADTGELEIKIAYLEKHIEEQDRAMFEMSRQMDRLERQVIRLTDLVKSGAGSGPAGPASPADERPPHY